MWFLIRSICLGLMLFAVPLASGHAEDDLDRMFPVDSPPVQHRNVLRAPLIDTLETQVRAQFSAAPIAVQGLVRLMDGAPLANASVQLGAMITSTNAQGFFRFNQAPRQNEYLKVQATGYHTELIALHLRRPMSITTITVDPVLMTPELGTVTRFLFGGDVSFGRRFIDPDESTPRHLMPPDDPTALIQVSNALPGTLGTMQFMRPFMHSAEYVTINLETPVTTNTTTPHPTKDYAFFTLPTSLPALLDFNIDYATLGNNHVYDYLDAGLLDTFNALQALSMPYSGAGMNHTQAFVPFRFTQSGSQYSFVTATSVYGEEHPISYVATASKGGAADLRDTSFITDLIASERNAGYFPIVQWHTGQEYTYEPSDYAAGRMSMAVDAGAAMVIAHHPHVAQGFEYDNGVLIAHSLGNFIFDQDRLETMFGELAMVDVQGDQVQQARAIPMYIEDYRPRPTTGLATGSVLRRISEFSRGPTRVFPYNGQNWIQRETESAITQSRTVQLPVRIAASGFGVIDLRGENATGEWSVSRVNASGVSVRLGRDLLLHGDFEDIDLDPDFFESARWDLESESRFVCLSRAYRGAAGVCSVRSSSNSSDSIIPFRNRTRVMGEATNTPNRDLALVGYIKGENAGAVNIISRYYSSVGAAVFGEESAYTHSAGDYDWEMIAVNLHLPADPPNYIDFETQTPRANRLFIRHSPPASGDALVAFDEFAVVNWEESVDVTGASAIAIPHARDFLRVDGAPGDYVITVELSRMVPPGGAVLTDELFRHGFENP